MVLEDLGRGDAAEPLESHMLLHSRVFDEELEVGERMIEIVIVSEEKTRNYVGLAQANGRD